MAKVKLSEAMMALVVAYGSAVRNLSVWAMRDERKPTDEDETQKRTLEVRNTMAALFDGIRPLEQGDNVRWEYRWANPTNRYCHDSELEWKPVEPRGLQNLEQRLAELKGYHSTVDGKEVRQYLVRPVIQRYGAEE